MIGQQTQIREILFACNLAEHETEAAKTVCRWAPAVLGWPNGGPLARLCRRRLPGSAKQVGRHIILSMEVSNLQSLMNENHRHAEVSQQHLAAAAHSHNPNACSFARRGADEQHHRSP